MKNLIPFAFLLMSISLTLLSCNNGNHPSDGSLSAGAETELLNETFDNNSRGWIEEDMTNHLIEINDGFYVLHSKDSSSTRTSSYCLDNSHLFQVPWNYVIEMNFEISAQEADSASCGILLESSTFEYEFRFYETGSIRVHEYNYALEERFLLSQIENLSNDKRHTNFHVVIEVEGWNFNLTINDVDLGEGAFSARSWSRVVPFSGKLTHTKVGDFRMVSSRSTSQK